MHTMRPIEEPVSWYVTSSTGVDTILPSFLLPEKILTPEPVLTMTRAVNSSIQIPVGDGKPRPAFLVLPTGRLYASSVIALYRQLTDIQEALRTAVRLTHIENGAGELTWDLWPAASWLSSERSSGGKNAGLYEVDGYFAVKRLKPFAALILGFRVTQLNDPRILTTGQRRAVIERFGG